MIKISNVDYINTLPYKYAFENSEFIKKNAVVKGAYPAGCVDELLNYKADIGLVPVGALDMLKDIKLIQEYGIISYKSVDSVLLLSDIPKEKLEKVYLDYQSRSSNGFVRILSEKLWKLKFEYLVSDTGYENNISDKTGGLVIGDRALKLGNKFKYRYDIAEEWYKLTQKPAVFAVWVANNNVDDEFIKDFKIVLENAVVDKNEIAEKYASDYSYFDLKDYLRNKICYRIGKNEIESMNLYRRFLKEISD